MCRLLISITVVVFIFGCAGMRPKPDQVDAFDYMYPKDVEWSKPEQVLKSFYGAKKRGDWKKAFEICDFNEVLLKNEAKTIRDQWEKDAGNWKERYLLHDWYVVERERKEDTAIMAIIEFYDSKNAPKGVARDEYREMMKRYGKKWKLVAALPKDEEAIEDKGK